MLIGIDASRAFLKQRTGIEEYSYQVIKHLRRNLENAQVILYIKRNQEIDFELPQAWKVKKLWSPRLWTQFRLSVELFFHPISTLFVSAHTVPVIHPKNTIVTIHGLEYEFCPQAYSEWGKFYMRWSIRNSCCWAKKIIAVSNNTKQDLIKLYKVSEDRIKVIYEGVSMCHSQLDRESSQKNLDGSQDSRFLGNDKYLLFVGRLEERKNIVGIIKAFEILKEHYKIPHKLVLAGKFGYGEENIREELLRTNCAEDIILAGYVGDKEKWELLRGADVFLFPTLYEGFGLPILEAQSVGVPVVAGNNSSMKEITTISPSPQFRRGMGRGLDVPQGQRCSNENEDQPLSFSSSPQMGRGGLESTILVDPYSAETIADAAYKIISDQNFRNDIIKVGRENIKRFSWETCAEKIAGILREN